MQRINIVAFVFFILFTSLIFRLFYWQVYRGRELAVFARGQQETSRSQAASRGEILASDGSWLVASTEAFKLAASLPEITVSKSKIAKSLADLFTEVTEFPFDKEEDTFDTKRESEYKRLLGLLEKDDLVWVQLKTKVSPDTKNKIENLGFSGLLFEEEEARSYPEASASAHLLGFVGKSEDGSDKGYFGLEGYYDVILTGKLGFLSSSKDALGDLIATTKGKEVSAVSGTSLLTSVDKGVQIMLDKKLAEGVEKYSAASGLAVVSNPKTGEIIAMSAYPTFEPSRYWEFDNQLFLNPVISSSFEPGSIFKVLVMASALDAGVVKPDTKCEICSQKVRIDGYDIETWDGQYRPDSTMTEVIVNSDNVGMVYTAQKMGKIKLLDYLEDFGIGSSTEIDLQGESSPKLRRLEDWREIDLATASFGQGIAVTPIQMLRAVSTIANGGVMQTPKVVKKLVGSGWVEDLKPNQGKRVISEKAAFETTLMMQKAAEKGEAKWTYKKGFKVAGKTGTAQIPLSGQYDEEKTAASFIGFSPYDDPKFVMLVTLFEPQSSPWASETAAPLWYDVAEELFLRFGIQPQL